MQQEVQQALFRKVALERLSSPEQLDTLMRVITPKAWLALAPLLGLIVLALIWGWFGSIPTKVAGKCILINPTGLADIASNASGRITAVTVRVGDVVKAGQQVALVAQPELLDRIEKAEQRLRELQAQSRVVRAFSSQGVALGAEALAQQRRNLESRLRVVEEQARVAGEREQTQGRLLEQGLITKQTLLQTQQERANLLLDAENVRNQVKELSLKKLEGDKLSRSEVATIENQVNEAQRALDSLRESKKLTTSLTSPFDGRVVEIKAGTGTLVAQGSSVLNVELTDGSGGRLQAVIYVNAAEGKRVAPRMEAQIVPTTIKREEHGFLHGVVDYVADYPSTTQSMMLLLQNENLVRDLAGSAPPIAIRAALQRVDNFSGYQWSSAAGAPVKIASGTLCHAEIVVQTQRPLSLVIPIFRKSFGVD
jgi:HlyD family secretion protein